MEKEKKAVVIHVRLAEPIADALKRLATADDRLTSAYIARVLKQHVMAAGLYKEPEEAKPAKPKGRKP